MFVHTFKRIVRIQFVRRLIGAGTGALVALTAYSAYHGMSTAVQAYMMNTDTGATAGQTVDTEAAFSRIGELARKKMNGVH